MGSGQGVKKDVGRDGPGQPLVLPVRLGRALPRHACLQELAKEQIEGGSAGSRLQQETARPRARNDRSQPSPTWNAAGTWLWELAASVGCMCEPPCIWEASWDRSVKARIGQLALQKWKVAEMEREVSG